MYGCCKGIIFDDLMYGFRKGRNFDNANGTMKKMKDLKELGFQVDIFL